MVPTFSTISGAVRGKVPSGVSYDRALPRELADGLLGPGGPSHGFFWALIVEVVVGVVYCYEKEIGSKDDTCMENQCCSDRFDVMLKMT